MCPSDCEPQTLDPQESYPSETPLKQTVEKVKRRLNRFGLFTIVQYVVLLKNLFLAFVGVPKSDVS